MAANTTRGTKRKGNNRDAKTAKFRPQDANGITPDGVALLRDALSSHLKDLALSPCSVAQAMGKLIARQQRNDPRGQKARLRDLLRWVRGLPAAEGLPLGVVSTAEDAAQLILRVSSQRAVAACGPLSSTSCGPARNGEACKVTPPMASDADKVCFKVHGVLTVQECEALIARCDEKGWQPATLEYGLGSGSLAGESLVNVALRDSDRCVLHDCDRIASGLWDVLRPLIPSGAFAPLVPVRVNDCLRCLRYIVGQAGFAKHVDGRSVVGSEISKLTVQVYLNEGFDGGATRLCHVDDAEDTGRGVDVIPRTGMALVFDQNILHKGCPVTQGTKHTARTEVMYSGRAPADPRV